MLAYCHACGVDQATLRAALPEVTLASSTSARQPAAPLMLAPGAQWNLYGDGIDPILGAILSDEQLPEGAVAWHHVASYRYEDADDLLCGVVDRWHPLDADGARVRKLDKDGVWRGAYHKTFRQRRPAFPATGWRYKMQPYILPLYRLAELYHRPEGAPVLVCEGEKAVHALLIAKPGWAVTTGPAGADHWDACHTQQLLDVTQDGAAIVLWPDADAAGAKWLVTLTTALRGQRDVRVVRP